MTFTPTEEQEAIRAEFAKGRELRITARAGTGKTATLKLLARDDSAKKIYLAFNSAIKRAAEGAFPANTAVRTTHALAWNSFRGTRYFDRIPKFGEKQPFWPMWKVAKELQIRSAYVDDERGDVSPELMARLAMRTVTRFCNSDADEPQARHVPNDQPNLDDPMAMSVLKRAVLPYAQRLWFDLGSDTGKLRVDHEHYLKRWAQQDPRVSYDVILFDEAQDTNPAVLGVLKRQTDAQIVAVGDSAQSIYGWRGATDAMDKFGGTLLPLTQSFRFGPPIANEANRFLTLLQDDPPVLGIEAVTSSVVDSLAGTPADLVLCRTNAGVLKAAIEHDQAGRKVAIVGGGGQLKELAQDVERLRDGKRPKSGELLAFRNYDDLRKYAEHDALDMLVLLKLIDTYGTAAITTFVDTLVLEDKAEVRVSTAHKAKGLEAPVVEVGEDFYKEPKPEHDGAVVLSKADAMLLYVVVTRTQNVLGLGGLRYLNEFPVVISNDE